MMNKLKYICLLSLLLSSLALYSQVDVEELQNELKDTILTKKYTDNDFVMDTIRFTVGDTTLLYTVPVVPSYKVKYFSKQFDSSANKFSQFAQEQMNKFKYHVGDTIPDTITYEISISDLQNLSAIDKKNEMLSEINCMIDVATQKSLSARSAPSIITIISHEEIKKSGARDLLDVLNMVPGFYFALDEHGKVGLGIRGNWANDGRVLLLIDGLEMNDIYTAKLYFGNHYSVDLIKRIEIIRGPGSAMYGGFAEFGVINIITKTPDDQQGFWAQFTNGNTKTDVATHRNFTLYYGKKWENASFSASAFFGYGQRSDKSAWGFYYGDTTKLGNFAPLKNNSYLKPMLFNFQFVYKNLSIRSVIDNYKVTDITSLDLQDRRTILNSVNSNFTEIKYKVDFTEKLNWVSKLTAISQYEQISGLTMGPGLKQINYQFRPKLNSLLNWDINHKTNLVAGAEIFYDFYKRDYTTAMNYAYDSLSYMNVAAFGQLIKRFPFFNIILGGRYEMNPEFDESFVPRIGITKRFQNFHYKLLYSKAFRVPTVGNIINAFNGKYSINLDGTQMYLNSPKLESERSQTIEFEIGFMPTENIYLTLNIFDITTQNPISGYQFLGDTIFSNFVDNHFHGNERNMLFYSNFTGGGTQGFETTLKWRKDNKVLDVSYSFYSAGNKQKIETMTVSTFNIDQTKRIIVDNNKLLAFPAHKIIITGTYYFSKRFSVNMSHIFMSRRYGYEIDLANFTSHYEGKLVKKTPTFISNLFFNMEDIWKRVDFSYGIYNMFNSGYDYLQPYIGTGNPLPGPSREIVVKVSWDFGYKKNQELNNKAE